MKKIALFVLAAIFVLSLTACGRKNEDMEQNNSTPSTAPATTTNPTSATNVPDPTVNNNSTENNSSGNGAVGDAVDDMVPDATDGDQIVDPTDTTENK